MLQTLHNWLQNGLYWLGFLFGVQPSRPGWSPTLARWLQYGVLLVVALLLGWFSYVFVDPSSVQYQAIPALLLPFVQNTYVGILFVLFYIFLRLLIAAIRLFWSRDVSEFEDIDRAFDVGLESLARAGYDIQWLPVFLVTGASHHTARQFIAASGQNWKANGFSDNSSNLAVTFHASDEALLICLLDVGATVRQIQKPQSAAGLAPTLNARDLQDGPMMTLRPGSLAAAQAPALAGGMGQTLKPGALAQAKPVAQATPIMGGVQATLLPGQISGQSNVMRQPGPESRETIRPEQFAAARQGAPEKLTKDELTLNRRRLEYFCQRLAAERGEYCTINGLLQITPWLWTMSPAYEPLFASVQSDLQTIHDALHQLFPVVYVHSGLEELVGMTEFLQRGKELNQEFRDSRAGSRFPAGRPIDNQSATWVVERSLDWFRDWVFAAFAKNLGSPLNRKLYQMLCVLSDRRGQLQRGLKLSLGELSLAMTPRFSGLYFAATGPDAPRQAFVKGLIQRVLEEQSNVTWMPDWRARDRRLLTLTWVLAFVACAVLLADLYLVVQIWPRLSGA